MKEIEQFCKAIVVAMQGIGRYHRPDSSQMYMHEVQQNLRQHVTV